MIFQTFLETQKGTWYHKTCEECGNIRKIKIQMWTVGLLTWSQAYLSPLKTWRKDKVQVPQRNKILSLYCTVFGFISKNKEYKVENNI